MRIITSRTIVAAASATGLTLALAACGDGADVDGVDNGLGDGDVVNQDSPENEAPSDGIDDDAPMISLAGEEQSFQMRCLSDPDEPGAVIIATVGTDVDALSGSFGFEGRDDNLFVELDSGSWGVSDTLGEFTSLDIGPDGAYVVGEAVFETQEGDTETGTFNFMC